MLAWLLWACGGGVDTDVTVPPLGSTTSEPTVGTTPYATWPEGELDIDEFVAQYPVIYCETWDACITDQPCDEVVAAADELPACNYDGVAAYACVNGEWTCDERIPEFPLPREPEACDFVYECPDSYDKTP